MRRVLLEGVTKRFGDTVAVNDICLEIKAGDFFCLLGPSGCGKTTLLRMIAGLEEITTGDVRIGERRVNNLPECGIGFPELRPMAPYDCGTEYPVWVENPESRAVGADKASR